MTQCSENEIYDVYIRDDDTLLRTEFECRDIYVWSAEVVYRPMSLKLLRDAYTVMLRLPFLRGLSLNWVFNVNGAFCIMA